jgi:hypothetical protein
MKYANPIGLVLLHFLLLTPIAVLAQPADGPPNAGQPGTGGGRGRGGFGGRGFRFGGPALPAEQQAEVDKINAALRVENSAINVASSNLVVATVTSPADKEKIAKANDELSKAREAWAAKASQLLAENQASDKKLSSNAVAVLVQSASGRGGRGMFGRFGFPPGGPRGDAGRGRQGGGQPGAQDQ